MTSEQIQRASVVSAASAWLGTPFLHDAEIRGIGVDCAHLIKAVYAQLGLMPDITFPKYSVDWWRHTSKPEQFIVETADKYFDAILASEAQAGDWFVVKFGRAWSHCGILISSKRAICAWPQHGKVCNINCREDRLISKHERRYYSPRWKP